MKYFQKEQSKLAICFLLAMLFITPAAWAQNSHFTNNSDNTYTIHDSIGWRLFCDTLATGRTFSGKTVKLAADIGSAQAPVTRMAGKIITSGTQVYYEHPFKGNFDGQNHTLVFSCDNATMNYVAPFAYVEGGGSVDDTTYIRNLNVVTTITANNFRHTAGLIALQSGHVNVRNCHATVTINSTKGSNNPSDLYPAGLVSQASNDNDGTLIMSGCSTSGTISTDGKYAGGLVGTMQGHATITNCLSSVTINSSVNGDGTHGGLVAVTGSDSGIDIYGCLFNGRLLGTNTTCCGGFIGWRSSGANIYNSLFAPAEVSVSTTSSATFSRNKVDTYNSYFTYLLNDGSSYAPYLDDSTVSPKKYNNGQQGYSVTNNNHVAIAHTGTATVYNVSGITVYANETGLACNNKFYAAQGEPVSVQMEAGYLTSSTPTVTGATVSMSGSGPWSFTMPAANVTVSATYTPDPVHFSQSDNEYTIHTATGWGVFCDCLDDNTTYSRFSGKIVKLETDITVSRKAGYSQHDFCGTFDGQGHTLTFNYGTAGNPTTDQYVAPFSYISNDNNAPATIRNLHVNGDIYTSAKYAAGIVGQHWGTLNIENCRSSVVIHSNVSGDGTHGGIEAVNNGTLSIEGCKFDGKILTTGTTATTNCGGFVGWGGDNVSIANSLYSPAETGDSETEVSDATGDHPSGTFFRYQTSAGSLTNCYSTRTLGAAQGKQPHTVTAGEYVTVDAIALTGGTTIYNVSGITAYSGGGLEYGGNLYYGNGDALSLTLGIVPSNCYEASGYLASAGTLSGNDNPYTLTMPDEDVTVSIDPDTFIDHGLHSVALTIAGCSESKIYDGTALTGTRFVVTEGSLSPVTVDANQFAVLSTGDTLRVTLSSGSITNAGTLPNTVVIENYTIRNGIDYSCRYNITIATGSLTVTPQPVLITVNDADKEYGDADPTFTGYVTGLINESDLGTIEYYKTDNTLEQIGNYPDTLSAHYTPNSNYEVTIDKGDLTINCRHIITRISQGLRDTTGIDDCFSATNTSVLPDADSVKTLIGKSVPDIAANEYSVEITDVAKNSSSCNWKWERTYTITTSKTGYCPEESKVLTVSGGDQTVPVRSGNWLWTDGIPYQNACLASFNIDLYLPKDQDLFDDCSPMTITHTDTRTGDDLNGWTIRRDYEVTDACGNTMHDFVEVSGRDSTPPQAYNTEVIKDTLWAYTQCLCDSIHVINDFSELKTLFGLSDECTGDNISLVSKTRTFKAGDQGNHRPDTVVVAYTVADPYGNANTFCHAQYIHDTTRPTFDLTLRNTALCLLGPGQYDETVGSVILDEDDQVINRVANIQDNCTRLPGSFTVSNSIDLSNYTVNEGIRQYKQYWTVTDSAGNAFTDSLTIEVYPLPEISIDAYGTQTVTYGEPMQEISINSSYSTLSLTPGGGWLEFNPNSGKVTGQPDNVGDYTYTVTATSTYGCGSAEADINILVTPRPIVITAGSATKKYDGTPLTKSYYECTVIDYDNMQNYTPILYNDSIAGLTITGSQTNVGSSANVPSNAVITARGDATVNKNACYDITYGQGTLTVNTNDTLIKVVPGSGSKIYDGTPLTMTEHDDFTVIGIPNDLRWEATADGTVTNVIPGEGEKAVNAVSSFKIFDADGNNVTSYFTNRDTSATGTLSVMLGNNVNSASWQAISTPVHDAGQSYESIDHVTNLTVPAYDLFRYDEGSSTWQNQKYSEGTATGFDRMEPGRGYIYRCGNARTLTWDGEPNSADSYSVSLTANGTSDLKGFNLVGNPYPFKVRLNRDFYALGSDGTWQKHTSGDSLEVGQGVLVHTASGETLTFYAASRSTNAGSKGLPPLPKGLCLGGYEEDAPDAGRMPTVQFAHIDGGQLVVTGEGTLQAFDMMGRMLFSVWANNDSPLRLSQFPGTGVYILRLNGQSQKIVIK